MPIIYTELQVLGRQVPCTKIQFSFRQAIDERGRPSSVVQVGLLKVTLTGEAVGWGIWEALKFDEYRRVSGWLLGFDGVGQTAKRYAFYDAALVELLFHFDGRGTQGKQAATAIELHFSPAAVDLDGQYIEAYSVIPWPTDPQTSFRALTKPADPQPSAHLAALLTAAKLKAEDLATGFIKKVVTPAGELGTEFLGVGLAALARTASLTVGLLLTPTNSRDDPGYASEWEMYRRSHGTPLTPAQLRLAQLERLREQGDLRADEEAEMIALLASVKGIHIERLDELNSPNGTTHKLLPGECRVGSFKALHLLGRKGDDITPHHIPSDAFMRKHGVSRNAGICLDMEQPDAGGRHRQTKTFGGHMTPAQREAYYQMSPSQALEHDIADARRVYRDQGLLTPQVEDALQEVIRQNRATFPHLFH